MDENLGLDDNYPDVLELKREPKKILRIPKSMLGAGKRCWEDELLVVSWGKKACQKYITWVTRSCCRGFYVSQKGDKNDLETFRSNIHLEWTP